METPVESELVSAAQAGDAQALETLLQEYLPLVYNVVGRALNGHADVDDVVQETLLRAAQSVGTLREPDRFRSWLIVIATRQIQERARSRARRAARESSLEQLGDPADPALDFVDATVLELGLTGERRQVAEATRWLPPDDQRLLALWWQELAGTITRAELAAAIGIGPRHAAVRVQRMKSKLASARVVQRALDAQHRCPDLQRLLRGWDGGPNPRLLRRCARHIGGCQRCRGLEARLIAPESLLAGVGLVPVPFALAHGVPDLAATIAATVAGPGGAGAAVAAGTQAIAVEPVSKSMFGLKPALATGAAVTGAGLAIGLTVHYLPSPSPAPERPPGPGVTTSAPIAAPTTSAPAPPSRSPSASPSAAASPKPQWAGVASADWYVAPQGDDAGDGSLARPFATVAKAVSVVRPGQAIAVRGGRYRLTESLRIETDGTPERRITLSNYRDERPVIDASGIPERDPGILHRADYWTVSGLEVAASPGFGIACSGCRYNVFRRLSVHGNQGTGMSMRDDGVIGNQVLDSDFFDNHDDFQGGADADGLAFVFGSGAGNAVRRCRFYHNSDDGFAVASYRSGVAIESSWAWGNGVNRWGLDSFAGSGNGFRLNSDRGGPADHVVTNNAAWDNAGSGFLDDSNSGRLTVVGNSAFRNSEHGFSFMASRSTLRRNLSLQNRGEDARLRESGLTLDANSWEGGDWSPSRLRGTDPESAQAARGPDGGLPRTTFLAPREGAGVGATMTGQR